jgi:signal transduction histidine kinase
MTEEVNGQRRTSVRALIALRSPSDVNRVAARLQSSGYQAHSRQVDDIGGLRAALADDGAWDLVLGDPALPGLSVAAVHDTLQAAGRELPYIALWISAEDVGPDGSSALEDVVVTAMRAGACDFVDLRRLDRLGPAVDRALRDAVARDEKRRAREQLLVIERMASVGTLAAGVAHEINNPLAAVMANIELALRTLGSLPPEVPEVAELSAELRDAHEAAYLVRQIVRDVKLFSRPGDDRAGPVDVRQVLDGAARMAWNEIRHRARLVKDYGEVPPVWATEAKLGQVFLNVLINAAHALQVGRADSNRIAIITRTDSQGRAVVEIVDTGSGILPENLPRLFTPFFSTKPLGTGSGLGLAICRRIVRELGGEIDVRSQAGQGTTVVVTIPAARGREASPPVGAS